MGYIYILTNKINKKKYVGQTICEDINKRWNQYKKIDKQCIGRCLYNALIKYGINNFKFQIICICFDEDCNTYEKEYIKKYNTIAPNGYNLKEGGNNSKHHPETIELIRTSLKGRKLSKGHIEKMRINMTGKKHSEETKHKLSISLKGAKNCNYGKKYLEEEKEKLSLSIKKGLDKRKIEGYKQSTNSLENLKKASEKRKKCVAQYNMNNELIREYSSITEAEQFTSIKNNLISKVCNGKARTTGGFIWKFINT